MRQLAELLLERHSLYRGFRRLTGSGRLNREFVEKYVRPCDGDAILDIGCGPGDVCALMPRVRYTGLDPSPNYIAAAQRRFGNRAVFSCGGLASFDGAAYGEFDAVMCMGVMHHLDDRQVLETLEKAKALLKRTGRFVSYDPCFTEPQHPIARWIHKHDRGAFVRFDRHYERLISTVFQRYRRDIRTDLCTVPATVIIFECDGAA